MHGKTPSQLRFEKLRKSKSYIAKTANDKTDTNYELMLVECDAVGLPLLNIIKLAFAAPTLDDAVVAVCNAAKVGMEENE